MSSSRKGDALEAAVFALLAAEIEAGRFFVNKDCSRIFRRKGYYSKDRESEIVFDVSIEIYLPDAEDYSILVLVECKNYGHTVPVDDIEEFYTKAQQVGAANTKAIVVTSSALQSGALTFAKSKKMGLARYFYPDQLKWELRRSPSASFGTPDANESEVISALTRGDYRSAVFDLFMQSPSRSTNSLWHFFEDLILDSGLEKRAFRTLCNPRGKPSGPVPFLQKSELERLADESLELVGYDQGQLDLDLLCERHPAAKDLRVRRTALPQGVELSSFTPLGRISFEPLQIDLLSVPEPNVGRDRFTFAHELSHLLLGHGSYMRREYCDEADYEKRERRVDSESDVGRMEYQANYFAACLLMPRESFVTDFLWELRRLDIYDKGFGLLYVDGQECNINSFMSVTGRLMRFYGASRAAVSIRLEGLGLLRDARRSSVKSVQINDPFWPDVSQDD